MKALCRFHPAPPPAPTGPEEVLGINCKAGPELWNDPSFGVLAEEGAMFHRVGRASSGVACTHNQGLGPARVIAKICVPRNESNTPSKPSKEVTWVKVFPNESQS